MEFVGDDNSIKPEPSGGSYVAPNTILTISEGQWSSTLGWVLGETFFEGVDTVGAEGTLVADVAFLVGGSVEEGTVESLELDCFDGVLLANLARRLALI